MATEDFTITPSIERAKRFYWERIKPRLGDRLNGQWIVIDANSGEFEMDHDVMNALSALEARVTDLDRVFVRDGEFTPGHLGGLGRVLGQSMSAEERAALPPGGALNYKHFLYGFPKREKYPWQE